MRKALFFVFFGSSLGLSIIASSQTDSARIVINQRPHLIKSDSGIVFSFCLQSLTDAPIFVYEDPYISTVESDLWHIGFRLEKLDENCFKKHEAHWHMLPPLNENLIETSKICYDEDISGLYSFKKGLYRAKIKIKYQDSRGRPTHVESDWSYFELLLDLPRWKNTSQK